MPAWSKVRTSHGRGTSPGRKTKPQTEIRFTAEIVCLAFALVAFASPLSSSESLRADIDRNRTVDFTDFLIFAESFNLRDFDLGFDPRSDLNGDGTITFDDFLILVDEFGSVSPDVGNDRGNGDDIVHGPNGPEGGDRDNPFRSLTVHPDRASTLLLGTERNGFVRSDDGGETWTRHREGLRHNGDLYPEIWDITYDPANPEIVYAATLDSPGPVTGDYPSSSGGVYRSADGGNTWSRKNCGLVSSRITGVTVLEGDSSIVIIGVEGGTASFSELQGEFFAGGLYWSGDGGERWERAVTAVDDTTNGYLHIIPRVGVVMTFGKNLDEPNRNGGFLKSEDNGRNWESFGETLRTQLVTEFSISSDGQTLVGNARDSYLLQVSRDGGMTWTATEINQANGPVTISPADSDRILFVASQRQLKLSSDGLKTFTDVLSADGNIAEVVFAESDPNVVYCITEGSTFYRSEDAGGSFVRVVNIRSDVLNP